MALLSVPERQCRALGENHFAATPVACYSIVLLTAALADYGLQKAIIRDQATRSRTR